MLYLTQHTLLERLGEIERMYAGLYPTKQGRRFTVKYTTSNTSNAKNPYLYTWVNFKKDETEKYSIEADKMVKRNSKSNRPGQQTVYICPVKNLEHNKVTEYFTSADEGILETIQALRERLEKQITLISKYISKDSLNKGYRYEDFNANDQQLVESMIIQEMIERYPNIFEDGEETLNKIEEAIEIEEKKKKMTRLYIEEKELMKKAKLKEYQKK